MADEENKDRVPEGQYKPGIEVSYRQQMGFYHPMIRKLSAQVEEMVTHFTSTATDMGDMFEELVHGIYKGNAKLEKFADNMNAFNQKYANKINVLDESITANAIWQKNDAAEPNLPQSSIEQLKKEYSHTANILMRAHKAIAAGYQYGLEKIIQEGRALEEQTQKDTHTGMKLEKHEQDYVQVVSMLGRTLETYLDTWRDLSEKAKELKPITSENPLQAVGSYSEMVLKQKDNNGKNIDFQSVIMN